MCKYWCAKKNAPIPDAKVHNFCLHQNNQNGCINLLIQTRRKQDKGFKYCQVVMYNGMIVARIRGG